MKINKEEFEYNFNTFRINSGMSSVTERKDMSDITNTQRYIMATFVKSVRPNKLRKCILT